MSRRRLFGSLCSLVFLVNLGRVVFAPLVEPLAAAFAVDPAAIGPVASLAWLGSAIPRIPTGYLLTRVSRTRVVAASGLVLAVAAGLTALAPSVPLLMVGAFLMGLASGSYFIAANPLVSELFPDRVGRALGVHGTAAQLAAVGAPLLVGAALAVGGWQVAFVGIAAVSLLATAGAVLAARGAELPEAGAADRDVLGAARGEWPILLAGIAVVGTAGFVWNGVFNFYVTYLRVAKSVPPATGRTLLTVVFAAGVPAFLVTGRLADRLPNVPLLLAIVAGFVACVLALTLTSGLLALAALSAVLGYVVHGLFPAVDTYLLGSLPDHHRASAYAVFSGTMMIVQSTGSGAVGLLVGRGYTYDAVFTWFAVGLAGVLAVLTLLYLAGWLPAGSAGRSGVERPAD